jgi:CRP-like cAMP-binding protein
MKINPIMPDRPIRTEEFLAYMPLFRQLEESELSRIARGVTEIAVPRGGVLFRRGEPCTGFHIVVYGQIKLSLQDPRGAERVVELIGPGQSFGEAVMFLEKPYMVGAMALADTKLLHVKRETVFSEIDLGPRFARRMIAGLSYRLHHLMMELEMVTFKSGTQRVIGYLLRNVDEVSDARCIEVTLSAQKNIIASRLNITQEHFSRILHELATSGLIEVHGRTIRITDREKLSAFDG